MNSESSTEERDALQGDREVAAVRRWHPGYRFYYPLLARLVVLVSNFVTRRMNSLVVEDAEAFAAVRDRGRRGLLTISNHVSMFDDPLLVAGFVSGPYAQVRWIASDALNFFGSPLKAWLFTAGRCVPVVRGAGIDQPGLMFLRDRLKEGAWVHMFPEGGRTRDPRGLLRHPFKAGVGRLIAEANPIVLPFYHYGMHAVLPIGAKVPRRGKTIRLAFGEAVDCSPEFVGKMAQAGGDGLQLWQSIANVAYEWLHELELNVHPLARESRQFLSPEQRPEAGRSPGLPPTAI